MIRQHRDDKCRGAPYSAFPSLSACQVPIMQYNYIIERSGAGRQAGQLVAGEKGGGKDGGREGCRLQYLQNYRLIQIRDFLYVITNSRNSNPRRCNP